MRRWHQELARLAYREPVEAVAVLYTSGPGEKLPRGALGTSPLLAKRQLRRQLSEADFKDIYLETLHDVGVFSTPNDLMYSHGHNPCYSSSGTSGNRRRFWTLMLLGAMSGRSSV